ATIVAAASSWWTIQILIWMLDVVLLAFRRWRHLFVAVIVIQLAQTMWRWISDAANRPRPFGVRLEAGWGGWALPSDPMLAFAGMLVLILYTVVPGARWRNAGKWIVWVAVSLVALARLHLGVDAPTDIIVAVVIAVALPMVAFRIFV